MPFNQKIPLLLFLARCYRFCSNAGCFPTNLTCPVLKGQCCPSIRMQSRCALAHTHTHTGLPAALAAFPTDLSHLNAKPAAWRTPGPELPGAGGEPGSHAPRHRDLCLPQRSSHEPTARQTAREQPLAIFLFALPLRERAGIQVPKALFCSRDRCPEGKRRACVPPCRTDPCAETTRATTEPSRDPARPARLPPSPQKNRFRRSLPLPPPSPGAQLRHLESAGP